MSDSVQAVLIVDDEPEVLASLRRQLRREPFEVVTVESPFDALKRLEEGEVDLLIADIDMPGMTGLELVARARECAPNVVRMLLTGDASLDSALDAINCGEVHRYLLKPWKRDELLQAIREGLARAEALRNRTAAGHDAARLERILTNLERDYPGIRSVSLRDGAYVVDASRVRSLGDALEDPALRSFVCPGTERQESREDNPDSEKTQ